MTRAQRRAREHLERLVRSASIVPLPAVAESERLGRETLERQRDVERAFATMAGLGFSPEQTTNVTEAFRRLGISMNEAVNGISRFAAAVRTPPAPTLDPPIEFELQGEPVADVDAILVWSRSRAELSEAKAGIAQPPQHGADAAGLLLGFVVEAA